jgi:hypothetical protein
MAAHCSADMAPVPESVSRSTGTSSAASSNKLYPAASRALARSPRVVSRTGSTEWIRNGSMIVRKGLSLEPGIHDVHWHSADEPDLTPPIAVSHD